MKSIIKILLLSLFIISNLCFSQTKDWQSIFASNGNIEIKYPSKLKPMSDEMFNLKYRMSPMPEIRLSDDTANASIIGTTRPEKATDKDLEQILKSTINVFHSTRKDIHILDSGLKMVNNKKIGFVKFHSEAIDQKVFNYLFFTVVKDKLFMCSFNCTEKIQKEWEPIADEIVKSIVVKN